jgi:hypothetical protein
MAIITARDMITKSLKLLGIGAEGETLTAAMLNDGLDSLNLMLSLWGARNLMTLAEIQENFNLTALQSTYTIGVTSIALPTDLNTTKPYRICSAFIRDSSAIDSPISLISREEYNAVPIKTTPGRPDRLAQYPGATQQTNQVMTLYLYPTPDASTIYTLYLYSEKPLTWIATLDDLINVMENVYIAAFIPNLALALAPEYGVTPLATVINMANDTMSAIENINSAQKRTIVDLDLPKPETGNIMTGG